MNARVRSAQAVAQRSSMPLRYGPWVLLALTALFFRLLPDDPFLWSRLHFHSAGRASKEREALREEARRYDPPVGEKAPLLFGDERNRELERAWAGKRCCVVFASGCSGSCGSFDPSEYAGRHARDGFDYIVIGTNCSVESELPSKMRTWMRFVCDRNGDLARAYNIRWLPREFEVDEGGVIRKIVN